MIRRDSKGASCTNINGVLDYNDPEHALRWSTCSVELFTKHYNDMISANGNFCMALAGTPGG